jgi:hypothetical protein
LDFSHHFDTPTGREDPRLNLCDFYLFASSTTATTAIVMTVNPAADAHTARRSLAPTALTVTCWHAATPTRS